MKILGIITVLAVVLVSCTSISPEEERRIRQETSREQKYLREQYEAAITPKIDTHFIDSLAQVEKNKKLASLKDSFQLIRAYTSNPNVAGGVDLSIVWKNKTRRIIKYATFYVDAINAVGDEVSCEIRGYGRGAKATGPFRPGSVNGYGYVWECMWYNSNIRKCKVTDVKLEFMDGDFLELKL